MRIAGRYRILAPLGWSRERAVYAADDLRSGKTVALQFLSPEMELEPEALAGWRQVSHPNVCKVLDLVESGGRTFLVLDLVKGESLDALLRRIGRLPLDKGLEIAQQLAAGLAAIHESGALHRNLNPANVILDGRGAVRMTGWGMPERAPSPPGAGAQSLRGYEAPERLAGGSATVRSDLYSLAAIVYEVLTGRPVCDEGSAELGAHPLPPSALARKLDARLDRALLQCLEREPQARPPSAKSLVHVLPGLDPLAAAVAAGETPSPEMVAAAPKVGSLRLATGLLCLAGVFLTLAGILTLAPRTRMLGALPLTRSTGELASRARSLLSSFGSVTRPEEVRFGFASDPEALARLKAAAPSPEVTAELAARRSTVDHFWYRESPHPLVPSGLRVTAEDPPRRSPGEAFLQLDVLGRLQALEIAPPVPPSHRPPRPVDWTPLFAAAGLDQARFAPRQAILVPPVFVDTLAAWQGSLTRPPDAPLSVRIEAGALAGDLLYFRIVRIVPWTEPGSPAPASRIRREAAFRNAFLFTAALLALLLSVRNLRRGRANLRWAGRLSVFVFLAWLTIAALAAPSSVSLVFWQAALGEALRKAAAAGLCYLGLEPFLRRRAPEKITSWSRVLAGSFRDPLVGRDVLVGTLLGSSMVLVLFVQSLLTQSLTGHLGRFELEIDRLNGVSGFLAGFLEDLTGALIMALSFVVLTSAIRMIWRRSDLGILLAWAIATAGVVLRAGDPPAVAIPMTGLASVLLMISLARFGLLTGIVHILTVRLVMQYPMTGEMSAWYAPVGFFPLVVVLTLAIGGFFIAVAGQPWFHGRRRE
jgi:serine/threonine-protein kinase